MAWPSTNSSAGLPEEQPNLEASEYQVLEKLRDGSTIAIRAIRADDQKRFARAFAQFAASPDSVRFRFHGFRRSPSEREATDMTGVDFVNHVALVATFGIETEQPLTGVGRYILCDGGRKRAELAFAVLDKHLGKGIGSLLLQHLVIIGKAQGLREFVADVLADNKPMLSVLEHSGFPIKRSREGGVERWEFGPPQILTTP
jgi:GNAT superfamily N-acetyltransferase